MKLFSKTTFIIGMVFLVGGFVIFNMWASREAKAPVAKPMPAKTNNVKKVDWSSYQPARPKAEAKKVMKKEAADPDINPQRINKKESQYYPKGAVIENHPVTDAMMM